MTFEDFEEQLWCRYGYGIVAMNHYTITGARRLYIAVLERRPIEPWPPRAFKAEGEDSGEVFADIIRQIEASFEITNWPPDKAKWPREDSKKKKGAPA